MDIQMPQITGSVNKYYKVTQEEIQNVSSVSSSPKNEEAFISTSIEVPGMELPIGRSYKNSVLENLQYIGNGTTG